VISLPYARTGGDLVITNGGSKFSEGDISTGENIHVSVFYSNCPHTVTPVRSGFRVTLACHILKHSNECEIASQYHLINHGSCALKNAEDHKTFSALTIAINKDMWTKMRFVNCRN